MGIAVALAKEAVKALPRSKLPVKTITFDNGLEFACHEHIARQLKAVTYFAHPYHSWERGLNENTNGLIRQYIPKSCPISIVRPSDVSWIEDQLNQRPRKTLGYLSPAEFAQKQIYALQMWMCELFQHLDAEWQALVIQFRNEATELMATCDDLDWIGFRQKMFEIYGVPYQTELFGGNKKS